MIQFMSPYRVARIISLLHHSILTTYYHTDTMLTSSLSLDVLHTLRGVCSYAEFGVKLNFVNTGFGPIASVQTSGKPKLQQRFRPASWVCTLSVACI